MRKPGEKTWTRGKCLNEEQNRSIQIEVDDRIYTINRIYLKLIKKIKKMRKIKILNRKLKLDAQVEL